MNEIDELSGQLGEACMAAKVKLAAAESCTGGGVGEAITRTAGSSAWFDRGFITYSNEAKVDLLGVREETIGSHGAVSEAVAREMAVGALHQSSAGFAVAVTGVAGPGGGTASKPVGLVWFAWASLDGPVRTLTPPFTPQPFGKGFEAFMHPDVARIAATVREMVA